MKKFCLLLFLILTSFFSTIAQNYTQDTQTIESTMEAVLDVISGPAGKKIDVVRWRNLFRGDVKFSIRSKNKEGQLVVRESSVEDYAKNIMPRIEAQDFFETVGNLTIDKYGDIAQVFMVYETRKTADGTPFDKGINSFQLLFDQNRWWVTSLMWQAESSGVPIPMQYSENIEKDSITNVIKKLFDGMRAQDSSMVSPLFYPNATLSSASYDKDDKPQLRKDDIKGFIGFVGTKSKDYFDERIYSYDITIDGPLATAWTEYSFFRNKELSHCGYNVFMLAKAVDGWKIISIADTRRETGCKS